MLCIPTLPAVVPFDLTHSEVAAMDMICGGQLDVLLEFIEPGSPAAAIVFKSLAGGLGFAGPVPFSDRAPIRRRECRSASTHCLVGTGAWFAAICRLEPATFAEAHPRPCGATCLRTVPLGESLILIDPVLPAETVFLFGAGHVAQPTARLAAFVGFRVRVVDDRAEFANAERFPEAEEVRVATDFDSALKGFAIDRRGFHRYRDPRPSA